MVRKDVLDELDWCILAELERDARASNRALARRLGVSAPTVAQRIRRMQDVGVIRGFKVDLGVPAAASSPLPVVGLKCAECKNGIQGPARTRRFHGRSYAFCCPRCEETFADRAERTRKGAAGMSAVVVVLGWAATFGLLGATCMGMGNCVSPGLAPPPMVPCPPGARGREEFEETLWPAGLNGHAAWGAIRIGPWRMIPFMRKVDTGPTT